MEASSLSLTLAAWQYQACRESIIHIDLLAPFLHRFRRIFLFYTWGNGDEHRERWQKIARTVTDWLLGPGEGTACGSAPLTGQLCLLADQLPRQLPPGPVCSQGSVLRWGCMHGDASGEEVARGTWASVAGWEDLGAR